MKKTAAFVFLFLSACATLQAQFKFPGTSNNDVRHALEKVLADFPKDFTNLKGEVLNNNPQSVEYSSLLQFASAQQNTIIEYSGNTPVYSWQAQMLSSEDFSVAEKKYKALFKDLKNMSLTLNRDYNYSLDGEYDAPDESRKFATTLFHFTPNASNLPKVKVELSMQYQFPEWKVFLLVYQREREDYEKGKTRD